MIAYVLLNLLNELGASYRFAPTSFINSIIATRVAAAKRSCFYGKTCIYLFGFEYVSACCVFSFVRVFRVSSNRSSVGFYH